MEFMFYGLITIIFYINIAMLVGLLWYWCDRNTYLGVSNNDLLIDRIILGLFWLPLGILFIYSQICQFKQKVMKNV